MPAVPPLLVTVVTLFSKMQSHFLLFNVSNTSWNTHNCFHQALMGPFAYRLTMRLPPSPHSLKVANMFDLPINSLLTVKYKMNSVLSMLLYTPL